MIHDVFISYRRESGTEISGYLFSELTRAGFTPFLDINEKYSGKYKPVIENSIKYCDLFVILLTENSIEGLKDEKNTSRLELEIAILNGKSILPISSLGESLFEKLKDKDLPSCVKYLKELNITDYNERYRESAVDFIVETMSKLRKEKFGKIEHKGLDFLSKIQGMVRAVNEQEVQGFSMNPKSSQEYYTGTIKLGSPMGNGRLIIYSEQLEYVMDWSGKGTGIGTITDLSENRVLYKGNIVDGKFEGRGILTPSEGVSYDGTFHVGEFIKGTMISDGEVYEGTVQCSGNYFGNSSFEPMFHGYGHLKKTTSENDVIKNIEYLGSFYKGKYNGMGTLLAILEKEVNGELVKADVVTYEGEWSNNVFLEGIVEREPYDKPGMLWSGKFSWENKRLKGEGFTRVARSEFNRIFKIETKLESVFNLDFVEFNKDVTAKGGEDYVYLQCEYSEGKPVASKFVLYNSKGIREIAGKLVTDKKDGIGLYMVPNTSIKSPKGEIIIIDYDNFSKVVDMDIKLKGIGNFKGKLKENAVNIEYAKYKRDGITYEDNKVYSTLAEISENKGVKIAWDGSIEEVNVIELKPNENNLGLINKYIKMT